MEPMTQKEFLSLVDDRSKMTNIDGYKWMDDKKNMLFFLFCMTAVVKPLKQTNTNPHANDCSDQLAICWTKRTTGSSLLINNTVFYGNILSTY